MTQLIPFFPAKMTGRQVLLPYDYETIFGVSILGTEDYEDKSKMFSVHPANLLAALQ